MDTRTNINYYCMSLGILELILTKIIQIMNTGSLELIATNLKYFWQLN